MFYDITACIVLFKNDRQILKNTINSFLNTDLLVKLYLIDNSPNDNLHDIVDDSRIEYIFNNQNLGFGVAHNIAIKKCINFSKYHLVLNPDIYYEKGNIEKIFNFMENNLEYGQLMPKILYPNGLTQFLCKNNPTPFDLFLRRFAPNFFRTFFQKRMNTYEYLDHNYDDNIYNIPYLSGCFMFFRTNLFLEVGLFDEKIFMYIEDADITRRFLKVSKNIYFPDAHVFHHFEKGSHKNFRLMLYSIHGAFIYFNKWGWFKNKQ